MGAPRVTIGWAFVVVFSLILALPATAQVGPEKEEAMKSIMSLMDAGNWKKAIKALKSYRRSFAKTDESKEEVDRLIERAKGSQALDKIETDFRRKAKARKAANKLTKLLKEYGEIPEVVDRGKALMEAVRSQYVLVIEDFEDSKGEVDDDDDAGRTLRRSLVGDPKLVKQGEYSCRWSTGRGWSYWSITSPTEDWSEYEYFCMWIYNEKVGSRPARIEIEPHSGGWHHFQYYLAIDWTGWKEIRVPLTGRTSKFGRRGNPSWKSIQRIDFDHDDDVGTPLNIIIDDIRLEKR
ncbi:MAG: hypothetical protein O7H41_19945 [Planctomycetota bacterium]|nr:hypothetical protein [Planctomycetota bacterium]